ncbi:TetR family transcriptional regulator [Williamsia phyllosphaerae]|uniref:TetR family transcriptional regulator n=1 Tax=Williamsia phyllosphaerae TaxID=885042 RepID=A0ABQ1VA12_9NOCA|nr:TetR family transcriptional regulator [Williamsia phyllosphaerae]GGF43016.1 TetR family transcriptional regulator [Williamsia phyllosphaerae]
MGDSAATRERILAAATVEFADHGIAGARVDRIAARAQANKSLIYSYFGNKDELFDVVFTSSVESDVGRTPFDADDLPGYAARYYDMYLGDPHLVRLLTWARLERTPHGALFADVPDHDVDVLADIADAQRRRVVVDDIDPADLWSMLIAMAATWAQSAIVHTATESEDPALHRRRRTALATAVSRAFCVQVY